MSQQPNSMSNGPSTEFSKEEYQNNDMQPKLQQNGSGFQTPLTSQPSGTPIANVQRPLTRIDSRTNFQFRPGFPGQQGVPFRPGVPPAVRQPVPPGQQFVPRNLIPNTGGQRPQGTPQQGPPQAQPFPQNQQRPPYRPPTPFPRPGVPIQQRPLFQQRSVPSFGSAPRPPVPEDSLTRSQTLDSSEIDHSRSADDNKNTTNDYVKAPSIAAMNNRSYSLSSNPPEVLESKEETRRRSVSSVDSYGEGRPGSRQGSLTGSTENLDKRQENDIPSRPESRSTSRMNKIMEDDDRSPSSLTDMSQKSPDISNLSDSVSKSQPTVSKTPDSASGNRPPASKVMENGTRVGVSKDYKLDLDKTTAGKSRAKPEGDNDSGVDESTQGNDQSSNGDARSPRKSKSPRTSSTPARPLSRGSKSPSLKSPDSNATTPGSATERKRVPMNKVQVGATPSPNLKVIRSKIGSLENANYKPGGGKVKIESKKVEFKAAGPRIEAKNDKYAPKGGDKKIVQQKLVWNAKSKVGSLENASHKPKGGEKKIESAKFDFKGKAKSKVGSKDNIKYQPGGGDVKIETRKIELNVTSKIGSLDNVKHRPGGGDKKIFDDREYLKQKSAISSIDHSLSGSQKKKVQIKEVDTEQQVTPSKPIEQPMSLPVNINPRFLNTVREEDVLASGNFTRRCKSARKKRTIESAKPRWRY